MDSMRKYLFVIYLAVAASGCSSTTRQPVDVDNDGTIDGDGLDLDRNGTIDAVDTDSDGDADGMDLDGDGQITIWARLGTGLEPPTAEQTSGFFAHVDPDLHDELDPQNPPPGAVHGEVPIAARVDLSDNLKPLNQGWQNSCTAFSVAATATLLRSMREDGDPNGLWASPAFIYERVLTTNAPPLACNTGTWIHAGLNTLVREGSATLTEVPYIVARTVSEGATTCAKDPQASAGYVYRIGSWELIQPFSRTKVKESLSAGRVVPFSLMLPPNFLVWNKAQNDVSGVFKSQPESCVNEQCITHSMLIVGYDDAKNAYRVLNSWGTDWGDAGYIWWDYDDFEKRAYLYAYTVTTDPEPRPFPVPDAAAFDMTVIGVATYQKQENDRWYLAVRVRAREPLQVSMLEFLTREQRAGAWLSYGDLEFNAGTRAPAPGLATVRIQGTLRDGSLVMKQLAITVPPPSTTGD